ncbi:baculoviral IAP repeat-containing protein 7-A-like [Panonychus citri]|uniref:baculoviral IAP repeat-containing protein 7-A-like n=1 Tax=Panonychus citri TaxID=50023 RepID=UPI002307FC32|nr:baculoviral IAP repeat-containing protein 7-A-like [Panonychus citri]
MISPIFSPVSDLSYLKDEEQRIVTFFTSEWGREIENRFELARDGYYYTGVTRQCKCIFCGHLHYASNVQDLYYIEHRLQSSNCPFMRNLDCGNIPYMPTETPNRGGWFEVCNQHSSTQNQSHIQETSIQNSEHSSSEGEDVIDDYPRSQNNRRILLHCNGTISNWEKDDNAWAVHAYFFPKYSFLYLKRGQLFIDGINSPKTKVTPLLELPEASEDKNRYTCKICLDKEVGTVFTPCDHAKACTECAPQLDSCPICKTNIASIFRLKLIDCVFLIIK